MTRIITLEGTFNTRDIGGILNKEGKCICYNRMIRSDALNKITIQDVEYLKHLGLKTIVDFRGKQEVIKAPDIKIEGVKEINLSPNAEVANLASGNIVDDQQKIDALIKISSTQEGRLQLKARSDEMSEQMRELVNSSYANKQYTSFINLLTDENNLPLLHHCKGGKDRTGFATIITLFILDVSLEKVKEEYMLTKECMASRNEKRMNEYRQYTNDPFVLELLKRVGPMLVTSANISGQETLLNDLDVYHEFNGKLKMIVKGKCQNTLASTVVKIDDDVTILRQGCISEEKIREVLK